MELVHKYDVWTNQTVEHLEMKRVLLIVNPNSGGRKGLNILDRVKPLLEKGGCTVKVMYTEFAGHAKQIAETEVLDDIDVFGSIGGDGTVHETINGFMNRKDYSTVKDKVSIAIFPGGTGNTLAYDLSVNTPEKAVEMLLAGKASMIDCSKVEDASGKIAPIYSINIIGYGLPAKVLKTANDCRCCGGAQYKLAAYSSLIGNQSYDVDVEMTMADDTVQKVSGRYVMIQAQCTVHMGDRMPFCPKSKLDNGLMDLVMIKKTGRLKLVKIMTDAEHAGHVAHEDKVEYHQVKSYSLTPKPGSKMVGPDSVNIDGELVGVSPFKATVMPRAVRMVAGLKNKVAGENTDIVPISGPDEEDFKN